MLSKELALKTLIQHSHVDYETGCYIWDGGIAAGGYGGVSIDYVCYLAHRLSAYIFKDLDLSLGRKAMALHKNICSSKKCWAPNHIYVGTQSNNRRDTIDAGHDFQASKTHCKRGHKFDIENTYYNNGQRQCKACTILRKEMYKSGKRVKE